MFDNFLEGKHVNLVGLNNEIINKTEWYKWFNNKNLTKFTKQGYFPNNKEKQKKYFRENILSNSRLQLGVVNKKRKKLIGVVSLYNINLFDRTCDIASIFDKFSKNMNSLIFFQEAQILLMDHAFNKMNMNRITAAANDKRLLKINEKLFGFRLEGIQRERDYIDGKYCDRHMLGILKSEWIKFNENRSD